MQITTDFNKCELFQGFKGMQGIKGEKGVRGLAGPRGRPGISGVSGYDGDKVSCLPLGFHYKRVMTVLFLLRGNVVKLVQRVDRDWME